MTAGLPISFVKTRKEKIVNGNGKRAARREKDLSRRLENGRTPRTYGWTFSAAFMRRRASRSNRRFARKQLAEMIVDGESIGCPCEPVVVAPFM